MKNLKNLLLFNKFFVVLILFISLYVILCTSLIKYESKYHDNDIYLEGVVTSLSLNGSKLKMNVRGKEDVVVSYYIKSKEEKDNIFDEICLGDKVKLTGEFSKPINNTIPNTFNYKKYLNNKKIFYTFTASDIDVKDDGNIFYKIKDYLLKRAYSLDNSEYFLVFLLGDKALLGTDELSNFQLNGVSHLLAISGMHIGVLLSVLAFLLSKFNEKKSFVIILIVLLFFLFLTGFAASIKRAVLFYILNRLNKFFDWRFKNFHLLLFTASIILLFDPFMIYDLGFIYSFVVCAGIILYQDKLNGSYLVSLFKLSLVSFLFSLPISAMVNYEINLASVFINLIFVPWISLVVYPFSLISFIFSFLVPVFSILVDITNFLNMFFAQFSLFVNIPKSSYVFILLLFVFLVLAKNNKKFYGGIFLVIVVMKVIPMFDKNYYAYFLDVGQGDCAVLVSPGNSEVVMIDTGGKITFEKSDWEKSSKSYNLSDNTILFLKSKGITKIDYLILSHGDADHAGEAKNIIKNMNVKNVVFNIGEFNYLEEDIKGRVNVSNSYNLKYFDITNLNNKDYHDENMNSIVNLVSFKSKFLLFMGDASVKSEEDILSKYKLPSIDIVKLGHHGSKTSTGDKFLNNVDFSLGIISSGRNNRFNHPSREVIKRLNQADKKYLNTQDSGTIECIFKKDVLTIREYKP